MLLLFQHLLVAATGFVAEIFGIKVTHLNQESLEG